MILPATTVSLFVCVSMHKVVCESHNLAYTSTNVHVYMLVFMQTSLAWKKQLLFSLRVKWANNYRRWPSLESVYKGECQWQRMSCLLHKYNTTLPFWREQKARQSVKWLPCFHRSAHAHRARQSQTRPTVSIKISRHKQRQYQHGEKKKGEKKKADVRVTGTFGQTPPGWHSAARRPGLLCERATVPQSQRTKTAFMWCSLSPGDYFWFRVSGNENVR